MPKLWAATVEAHRREVREAILATTAALVAEHGLLSVSMSRIAADAGIGRATLYKYFADVEVILAAWHEQQVDAHLAQLAEIRDRGGDPAQRVATVLDTYAAFSHGSREQHDRDLAALLHSHSPHLEPALRRVHDLISELLDEAIAAGGVRGDVPATELATYCLHALGAAAGLSSTAARRRLVAVIMAGLLRPG